MHLFFQLFDHQSAKPLGALNRTPTVFDVPSADEMARFRALFGK